jgi:hypothetical protein
MAASRCWTFPLAGVGEVPPGYNEARAESTATGAGDDFGAGVAFDGVPAPGVKAAWLEPEVEGGLVTKLEDEVPLELFDPLDPPEEPEPVLEPCAPAAPGVAWAAPLRII